MHWRFDPLFSIAVYHTKYNRPDPDTEELPRKAPDFIVEPASETAALLKRMGWVYKPQTGSCTVFGEKVFEADGVTATLRTQPPSGEGFTFLLRLKNPDLLNVTKPYVQEVAAEIVPNPALPAFSGRSRTLYFDNLNPTPQSGGELWLSALPVDIPQFGSKARAPFLFAKPVSGTTEVKLTSLSPGADILTVPINPVTNTALIEVPENGYQFVQKPGNQSEILFLTPDLPGGDTLGVIRIFKPAGSAGWESNPYPRYQIIFDKV